MALLLLLTGGAGFDLFRCAYTGEVQAACCCPADANPDRPDTFERGCCCVVQHIEAALAGSAVLPARDGAALTAALAPFAPLPAPTGLSRAYVADARRASAEAVFARRFHTGPPLIIAYRRLLI